MHKKYSQETSSQWTHPGGLDGAEFVGSVPPVPSQTPGHTGRGIPAAGETGSSSSSTGGSTLSSTQ